MRWQESLERQIKAVSHAYEFLSNSDSVNYLVQRVYNLAGFNYFTGIGKNGFVAAKVSSTFNSLGIRSIFIDPVNTLHGDMGIFSEKDLLWVISKSGETEELIIFVKNLIKNDFRNIIAVVSRADSTLSRLSEKLLLVPVSTEGDHLELAPVASSVVYMAVLQAIAVEVSSLKGFDKKDFVRNHPGGTLGKTVVDDGN